MVLRRPLQALKAGLGDDDGLVQVAASLALWQVEKSPDAILTLRDVLKKGVSTEPTEAAQALGKIGPEAKDAIGELRASCQLTEDARVAVAAAGALWRIEKDRKMIGVLNEKIKQRSLYRMEAITILSEIGPDAKEAIPAIKALLRNPEHDRSQILNAIRKIDPKALPF